MAPLLWRLGAVGELNDREQRLVEQCADRIQEHRSGRQLITEGVSSKPTLILVGWACRQRLLADGRRQLFELLVPGDIVGFTPIPDPLTTSVVALTRMETADATPLKGAALDGGGHPTLARLMVVGAGQNQARVFDHIVRLGRHTALERAAHLLVETTDRLSAAGIGDGRTYPFAPTQQVLADLLGLSMVHMNRTLQQLRREGLISLRGGSLVVLDSARLAAAAGSAPLEPGRLPGKVG